MRLCGHVNVLLLDQMLKFVDQVAPMAVCISTKASPAPATATVQRDPTTREFYLEGGAMMLADSGVVYNDEFDKMHDEDRAAANPVFGRYGEMRTPGETILSRFDTIFTVRDEHNEQRDHTIGEARHPQYSHGPSQHRSRG
ncbi:MCM-domain-containing protein [Calocera viscosa TUFC12733]|uniref:MCM-domain-containing protein n=1 Tax=Calocera viscosa (strain TUFC12733) TaxID=1330018 RepID=A0A167GTU8_CALVF|nr:MCM-domain-containing protein [Calocera viscosa TUFC12733]